MIRNFSQHGCHGLAARHGYKSCCHPVAVMILVMCVDNNGIQHNCEELMQEFEKFVVMAMNLGADFDSLPILDNPDNFVVHADLHLPWSSSIPCHSSTLLEITLLTHLQSNACSESSLVCPILVHYLLGITAMIGSQVFLVFKYCMLSSISVSSQSSFVYCSWAPHKN